MNWSLPTKLWVGAAVCLLVAHGAASYWMPRGYALTFLADVIYGSILLCTGVAFAFSARMASGRLRLFWILQSSSWALLLVNHGIWMYFDLVLRKEVPYLFAGDALLFVSGVPALAGLLLRPHDADSSAKDHLGIADFFLLLVWWVYLYLFFVIPWQYVAPNEGAYSWSYDALAYIQDSVLILVLAILAYRATGGWRRFYSVFLLAEILRAAGAFILNRSIDQNVYYSGSWYEVPYLFCVFVFGVVAFLGRGLQPTHENPQKQWTASWVATLAMMALLSLPVMGSIEIINNSSPAAVVRFRMVVTLSAILVMAYLVFVKQHRLGQELSHANRVLEEASLTDPLTGVRNRRYFYASIEADVGQALRAYNDNHDQRTRDLIFYVIDADNFKEVNDRYGHNAGDRVLIELARRISSAIRNSDVLVRWGGEEFLVISRYTNRSEAEILASRVLSAVCDAPFVLEDTGQAIRKTCSIGWAAFPWYQDDANAVHYEEVRTMADRALGEAKRTGKNRAIGVFPGGPAKSVVSEPHLLISRIPVEKLCTIGPAAS